MVAVITTIVSAATLLVALAAGFGWMITHFDRRLDRVETGLGDRIDRMGERLSSRLDRVGKRVGGVAGEVTDLKVAVARLEGPSRPPLQLTR